MAYWTHRHPAFGGSDIQCQDSTTCVRRASVSASPSGRELTCTQLLLADLVCAQVPPKSRAGQCRPASSGCVLKPLFCSSALPRGLLLAGRQAERGAPQAARRGQLRASAVCRRGRPDGAPLRCPLPPPAQWHCQREGVPAVALRLPCLRAGGVAGGTPPPPPRPPPAHPAHRQCAAGRGESARSSNRSKQQACGCRCAAAGVELWTSTRARPASTRRVQSLPLALWQARRGGHVQRRDFQLPSADGRGC